MAMKRVLIVEDDHEVNSLLCRYLEQRSFKCASADSAAQCIERLEEAASPDLILLDWELPDMDGTNLCAQIRRRAEGGDVPVIMMTGYQQVDEVHRFEAVGVSATMFKPFSPRELLAKIEEITDPQAE
ncbi:MAG TPA: response regulator [Oscillatoriaceae cyanobacterium]